MGERTYLHRFRVHHARTSLYLLRGRIGAVCIAHVETLGPLWTGAFTGDAPPPALPRDRLFCHRFRFRFTISRRWQKSLQFDGCRKAARLLVDDRTVRNCMN